MAVFTSTPYHSQTGVVAAYAGGGAGLPAPFDTKPGINILSFIIRTANSSYFSLQHFATHNSYVLRCCPGLFRIFTSNNAGPKLSATHRRYSCRRICLPKTRFLLFLRIDAIDCLTLFQN